MSFLCGEIWVLRGVCIPWQNPYFLAKENNLAKSFKKKQMAYGWVHVILKLSNRAEVEIYGNLDGKTLDRAYEFDKPC